MTTVIRGTIVSFSFVCYDRFSRPQTPDSAVLTISYLARNGSTVVVHPSVTIDASTLSATWDSAVAMAEVSPSGWRMVTWNLQTAGTDAVALDGSFTITANSANL